MRKLCKLIRRGKSEDGNASVEFALMSPLFFFLFISIFELGMATVRITMLEHGMDMTMRDIRLSTGSANITQEKIRDRICERAGLLKDCNNSLLVEMVVIDRNTFSLPAVRATCIDKSETALPVTSVISGGDSDLMFLRACFVVRPLLPTLGLGKLLKKDPAGNMQLVASSIFAQEPK